MYNIYVMYIYIWLTICILHIIYICIYIYVYCILYICILYIHIFCIILYILHIMYILYYINYIYVCFLTILMTQISDLVVKGYWEYIVIWWDWRQLSPSGLLSELGFSRNLPSYSQVYRLYATLYIGMYPLVNIQKTMENHHFFKWENPLLMAIFNSNPLNYQRVWAMNRALYIGMQVQFDGSAQTLGIPPSTTHFMHTGKTVW